MALPAHNGPISRQFRDSKTDHPAMRPNERSVFLVTSPGSPSCCYEDPRKYVENRHRLAIKAPRGALRESSSTLQRKKPRYWQQ